MPGGRAADDIRAAIEAAGGAIPYDEFVARALYGPHGFYTDPDAGGSAGRRGDFLTSPEVGPLFGAVVARYLDAVWAQLGRPDPFTVVDAGAGPGTLARAVLAARPACAAALRYVAVEVAARAASTAPRRRRVAGGPAGRADRRRRARQRAARQPAVPPRRARRGVARGLRDGGTGRSLHRGALGAVRPACRRCSPGPPPTAPGHRCRTRRPQWVGAARAIVGRGAVVVVDYTRARTAELAALPWRAWLRTYRGHERGAHPLADPGDQDITVDVAVDQLVAPDAVHTQAAFLRRAGIGALVAEGRAGVDGGRGPAGPAGPAHAQPRRRVGGPAGRVRARGLRRPRVDDCPARLTAAG